MSATAILEANDLTEGPKECQILILYEDLAAYERAVEVCRRMMVQFATELDFDFKCWSFIELTEADCARGAMKIASNADIILLAMHGTELPPVLAGWLAASPQTRFRADGALVLVGNGGESSPANSEMLLTRLEKLAGQAGMDFVPLTAGPVTTTHTFHNEDWLTAATRAEEMERPQFDHWGLNE
jgi:hypothetical protein